MSAKPSVTIVLVVIGALVIAGGSFFAGMYAGGARDPIGIVTGSSGPIAGTVTAINAASITLQLGDGSSKTITLAPQTAVFVMPQPEVLTTANIAVGSVVQVDASNNVATTVQIFSPAPPAVQQAASTSPQTPPQTTTP